MQPPPKKTKPTHTHPGLSGGPARRITVTADASPTTTIAKPHDSPAPTRRPTTPPAAASTDRLAAADTNAAANTADASDNHNDKNKHDNTDGAAASLGAADAATLGGKRKAEGEVMASPLPTGALVPASGAAKRRHSPEAASAAPHHTAALPTATKLGYKEGVTQCTGATTTVHDSAHTVLGKHIAGGRRKIGQGATVAGATVEASRAAVDMDETVPCVLRDRGNADAQAAPTAVVAGCDEIHINLASSRTTAGAAPAKPDDSPTIVLNRTPGAQPSRCGCCA